MSYERTITVKRKDKIDPPFIQNKDGLPIPKDELTAPVEQQESDKATGT